MVFNINPTHGSSLHLGALPSSSPDSDVSLFVIQPPPPLTPDATPTAVGITTALPDVLEIHGKLIETQHQLTQTAEQLTAVQALLQQERASNPLVIARGLGDFITDQIQPAAIQYQEECQALQRAVDQRKSLGQRFMGLAAGSLATLGITFTPIIDLPLVGKGVTGFVAAGTAGLAEVTRRKRQALQQQATMDRQALQNKHSQISTAVQNYNTQFPGLIGHVKETLNSLPDVIPIDDVAPPPLHHYLSLRGVYLPLSLFDLINNYHQQPKSNIRQ
jgi:hypothetical protein